MVQGRPDLSKPLPAIQPYGLAILSVSLALGVALFVERFHVRDVDVPLFLFAIAVSAWRGGGGAILALLLSFISFDSPADRGYRRRPGWRRRQAWRASDELNLQDEAAGN